MRELGVVLAGLAAALAACGGIFLLVGPIRKLAVRSGAWWSAITGVVNGVLAPLRRAGAEGRSATGPERRRLQFASAAASLLIALVFAGPIPAAGIAVAVSLLAPRALVWRRERYARKLGEGTGAAATRIADALASGHTTHAAISMAGELHGPIGRELSRVAAEIELGASTDAALAAFRRRVSSRRVDLLVAAIRLQRRSGGNLAALLRDVAAALEDRARLEAEARAETAQARFTSTVVLAMPLCVVGLYELVSPGALGRLTGSPLGAWLLGTALLLQAIGAVLVRRLARVDG